VFLPSSMRSNDDLRISIQIEDPNVFDRDADIQFVGSDSMLFAAVKVDRALVTRRHRNRRLLL
jgi:hypothetical protein